MSTNGLSKMKLRLYRLFTVVSILVWGTIGTLILGSILNDLGMAFINVVMGLIFYVITYYLYLKKKNGSSLFLLIDDPAKKEVLSRFLNLELIFYALASLVGLAILSGTISRVFFEKFAVFG